jgi:hypothetical protein
MRLARRGRFGQGGKVQVAEAVIQPEADQPVMVDGVVLVVAMVAPAAK